MKRIDKYITLDNVEHASEKEALRYAERLVSEKVFHITDKLFSVDNRAQVVNYIMTNLAEFEILIALEKDTKLEKELNDD